MTKKTKKKPSGNNTKNGENKEKKNKTYINRTDDALTVEGTFLLGSGGGRELMGTDGVLPAGYVSHIL